MAHSPLSHSDLLDHMLIESYAWLLGPAASSLGVALGQRMRMLVPVPLWPVISPTKEAEKCRVNSGCSRPGWGHLVLYSDEMSSAPGWLLTHHSWLLGF